MEFRTEVKVKSREPKIDYNSKIFLLGSCFVENIGKKFEYYKFRNFQNPFGILYHPAGIQNFLRKVNSATNYRSEDLFLSGERWQCFDAHSDLGDPEQDIALQKLNENLLLAKDFIGKATHVIITLGTAWGYRNRDSNKMVANCHKLPQKNFYKELTSVEEIQQRLQEMLSSLQELNPKINVVFTISPVRHFRDGIVENQRSKSHLITALHHFLEKNNKENLHYFPSYEIMMDDLRDYRFYGEDMLHPASTAIDYIWDKFSNAWLSTAAAGTMKEVEAVQKGLLHRPFHQGSQAHKKFREDLNKKIENLKIQYSHLVF